MPMNLSEILGGNIQDQGDFQDSRMDKQKPPIQLKSRTTETGELEHEVTMSHQDLMNILKKMDMFDKTIASMNTRASQLQAREDQIRKHPILSVLTQFAGQLAASDKRLPPQVSAMGRANLALNPTMDELARERLGVEKEVSSLESQKLGAELEVHREQRLYEKELADIRKGHEKEWNDAKEKVLSRAAQEREFGPATQAATRDYLKAFGRSQEEIDAVVKMAERVAVEKDISARKKVTEEEEKAAKAEAQKAAGRLQLEGVKTSGRLAVQDKKYKLDTEEKTKLLEEKAKTTGVKLGGDAKKAVVQMHTVKSQTDRLRKLIDDNPDKVGLLKLFKWDEKEQHIVPAGGLMTKLLSQFSAEDADFISEFDHVFAQLAKSYGGARGFSKVEQPVFRSLAGSVFKTPEANKAILKNIDDWADTNVKAWMVVEPGLKQILPGSGLLVGGGGTQTGSDIGSEYEKWKQEHGK